MVGELAEESLPESVSHRGGGAVAVRQMTVPVMELGSREWQDGTDG